MEFFWKLEVNTAKQWGDITASRGAISTASLWLGLSHSLSSFRKKDVRRVLSFSLQEQSSTFCLSELLLRKKAKKIMLSSKNLGFFARQTQCSVNNGMRIMCVDKQSSVQSVLCNIYPEFVLNFFLLLPTERASVWNKSSVVRHGKAAGAGLPCLKMEAVTRSSTQ